MDGKGAMCIYGWTFPFSAIGCNDGASGLSRHYCAVASKIQKPGVSTKVFFLSLSWPFFLTHSLTHIPNTPLELYTLCDRTITTRLCPLLLPCRKRLPSQALCLHLASNEKWQLAGLKNFDGCFSTACLWLVHISCNNLFNWLPFLLWVIW